MSRRARTIGLFMFGFLAIVLLGYAAYSARARILELEDQVRSETIKTQLNTSTLIELWNSFHRELRSEENFERVERLAGIDDFEQRAEIAEQVVRSLSGHYAEFPEGAGVVEHLNVIVGANSQLERAEASRRYLAYVEEITGFARDGGPLEEPMIEAPVIVEEETANAISALTAAFGGLVSALISVALFFKGGGRRDLEEEMLSSEVEMKRLEVDQFRSSIENPPKGQAI